MRRFDRTAVAIALVSLVVSIPCLAWYLSGSQAVREEASRLERQVEADAALEAQHSAQQLTLRLEALRHSESLRSFLDYASPGDEILFEDCDYERPLGSPLAEGPADPLVWAHFQIDEVGQLTLPSLAPGQATARAARSIHLAIFEELECSSTIRHASLHIAPPPERQRRVASSLGPVTVGSFQWHTATIKDQPSLVALREVSTTTAVLSQGFVVLAQALQPQLVGSRYPMRVRPGEPQGSTEALIALDQAAWTVEIDAAEELALARAQGDGLSRRFRWRFFGGALGAALTGALIVGLVWQTERQARIRSQFAASAAHELRTPLSGLQLFGEMLADGPDDRQRQQRYARRIAEEADRLGRVVGNVLGFSQLERGNLTLRVEPGDLAAVVRETLLKLGPALEARGVRLLAEVADDVPAARFDRDAVHQIIQNLVDNAEKYSRAAENRTIEVVVESVDGRPTVAVLDRGPGVEPGLQRRLFRPFSRRNDADLPAGLGIGLALVHALAERQRAQVQYADRPGGGSRFSVSFDCADRVSPGARPR